MKRRLVLILLLLVGGAIVNVAVAWVCVMIPAHSSRESRRSVEDWLVSHEQFRCDERMTIVQVFQEARDSPPPYDALELVVPKWGRRCLDRVRSVVGDNGKGLIDRCHARAAGFPLLAADGYSMRAWVRPTSSDAAMMFEPMPIQSGLFEMSNPFTREPDDRARLPFHPIWPGLAINTVFYAALLWLLFAGPFELRRRRRIRRGLCPKCAYDLRGTNADICAECGASVPKQKAQKQKA